MIDASEHNSEKSGQTSGQRPSARTQHFIDFEAVFGRLKEASQADDETALAKVLGVERQSVNAQRSKRHIPPGWIFDISQRFNVSADWILFGSGNMKIRRLVGGHHESELDGENYRLIPLLESRVTGGPEGEVLYEDIADYLPFKRAWVERLVGRTEERQLGLLLVRVRGDSMSPTINQGEIVLIDTYEAERLQILDGRIYLVILPDGSSTLKRLVLKKDDSGFKLVCLSDNTQGYRPFEFELDPSKTLKHYILGRVRWCGKEFD